MLSIACLILCAKKLKKDCSRVLNLKCRLSWKSLENESQITATRVHVTNWSHLEHVVGSEGLLELI